MDAVEYYQDYIAHFGTKGQTWGLRRYQSYETAPTRSGMVGQEVGEASKQSARLEKFRGKLTKESDKWYDAVMTGASKRYNRASGREQKLLDKSTKQTADMTARLQSFGDNPSHKQKKEAMRMASKQLSIERKVAMAKAKTEKERRAVNDAYINKMCSQAAIETMTYKDLKKERNSRRWETVSAFVLPPAIAGALSATGKINRRDARTKSYRDQWTYTDPETGNGAIALTENGRKMVTELYKKKSS